MSSAGASGRISSNHNLIVSTGGLNSQQQLQVMDPALMKETSEK